MLITFNDHGILTNREIKWSDAIINSYDTTTSVASVYWEGHEGAGTTVNVTDVCGGKKKRDVDVIGDWLPGEAPRGTFEGVVPSGGGEAKIAMSSSKTN
jgi:hypothetical protein